MYIAIRTDMSDTELYRIDKGGQIERQKTWPAGRTLARDLPGEIDQLIEGKYSDATGIIVFKGPGSFTGLRIGITVANALAYSENIPIVGVGSDSWLQKDIERLSVGDNDKIVMPEYGAAPNITTPKK